MNEYDAIRLMKVVTDADFEIYFEKSQPFMSSVKVDNPKQVYCKLTAPQAKNETEPRCFNATGDDVASAFLKAVNNLREQLKDARRLLDDITTWQMLEAERKKPEPDIDQPACGGY
ncbi:MAG: hypothetical protein K2X77_18420 [Candidatus Obscuribacterales bacterium]|jgi:putative transposon-encoded protein|nr:hypothetical protein [Candidatus Obscuribacterales bacterium]